MFTDNLKPVLYGGEEQNSDCSELDENRNEEIVMRYGILFQEVWHRVPRWYLEVDTGQRKEINLGNSHWE